MEDLEIIIKLVSKYGTPAGILGFLYLITKLTKYVMNLLKKINSLEIQLSINKERLNRLERSKEDDL